MDRAQSSVEFMIITGFVLFFFVAFLVSIALSSSDRLYERQMLTIQQVARMVQEETAFAHATVDGYSRTFELPLQIVNLDYELDVVDGRLYVHTLDGSQALSVLVKNVTGTFVPGTNVLRRSNGLVYVND